MSIKIFPANILSKIRNIGKGAYQTVGHKEYNSLLHYYSDLVSSKAPELLKTPKFLVADAYFSKKPFVDAVTKSGFELISRFRNDAVLQYRYLGLPKQGRGRPRKFQGKVDVHNLDEQHFKMIIKDTQYHAYYFLISNREIPHAQTKTIILIIILSIALRITVGITTSGMKQ